jgi:hypothetical protein
MRAAFRWRVLSGTADPLSAYVAEVPRLSGCMAPGSSKAEATQITRDAITYGLRPPVSWLSNPGAMGLLFHADQGCGQKPLQLNGFEPITIASGYASRF